MLGDIGFGGINVRDFLRGDLFRDILGGLDLDFDFGDIFDGIGDLFGGIFHKGGRIPGMDEEDVPIIAQAGEYVVQRQAVQDWGPLLEAINSGANARQIMAMIGGKAGQGPATADVGAAFMRSAANDTQSMDRTFKRASSAMQQLPTALMAAMGGYSRDLPSAVGRAVRAYKDVPEPRAQRKFGTGGDAIFSTRTLMEVGEQGPERVEVTPLSRSRFSQGERRSQLVFQGPVIANDLSMKALVRRLMREIEVEGRRMKK